MVSTFTFTNEIIYFNRLQDLFIFKINISDILREVLNISD